MPFDAYKKTLSVRLVTGDGIRLCVRAVWMNVDINENVDKDGSLICFPLQSPVMYSHFHNPHTHAHISFSGTK